MKIKNIALIIFVLTAALWSCEEYDEYIKDYDYSAVYFGTQKPLRTIVAYDEMTFKVGVVLGGKRENNKEEWATFNIDESLLNGTTFTLLPANYYTLSDPEKMVVPKGEFIGDVTVTLNREAFTSDPLAHLNTYALPFKLEETSADTILEGKFTEGGIELVPAKDYTVLVVKYISPLHGTYYHKGVQWELDINGEVVDTVEYRNKDLSKNQTWNLTTQALYEVETSGLGTNNANRLKLTKNEDNSVVVEAADGITATVSEGSGTYNDEKREFYLSYKYSVGGKNFNVADTLILRQAPEKDLRFEEW